MDYPPPYVVLKPDGTLDLSQAYAVGIGAWDKVAITYGYSDFPTGTDEKAALDRVLAEARARNLTFLTDEDADDAGAHPEVSRWDGGPDATAELLRTMRVRHAALQRFGANTIRARANSMPCSKNAISAVLRSRCSTRPSSPTGTTAITRRTASANRSLDACSSGACTSRVRKFPWSSASRSVISS